MPPGVPFAIALMDILAIARRSRLDAEGKGCEASWTGKTTCPAAASPLETVGPEQQGRLSSAASGRELRARWAAAVLV